MKRKTLVAVATVIAALVTDAVVGTKILNSREEKDSEYTDENTDRKLSNEATIYERYVKRGLDISIAFIGIVLSAPVVAVSSLFIYKEDPGNVIFKQKRVGINNSHFNIHKLRSMKQNTGDIPTHLLSKEAQDNMILKVGKFIRKTSIDELPQFIDILRGRMSLIGPRPALWNQADLIAERNKYGVNSVRPGLTGLAQVSGRDSLSISDKARYDAVYLRAMRGGNFSGFKMDCMCFFLSIKSVLSSDGVVEGGTGSLNADKKEAKRQYTDNKTDKELIGNIGFGGVVEVDNSAKKRVLITGAGSYIGQSFIDYVKKHYTDNFDIEELDLIDGTWREKGFSAYDIVYHVAGIAHADVGNVDEATKEKYYDINTNLAIEVAAKAKADGVKEFIFMSSMIVYGDSAPYGQKKVITEKTVPMPANFYGDSKLQADVAVRELADDKFKVIVLRPPMIYGRGSKGNYPTLAKLAKKLPVFPDVKNERSMLYIENLCEFLCQVMLVKEIEQSATVLIPQNAEWTNTSEMVEEIAKVENRNIVKLKALRHAVALGGKVPGKIGGLVNKAFGNSCYAHEVSKYEGVNYQVVNMKESVSKTEGDVGLIRKRVLFLVNHDVVIYNFRLEIVERLLADGYEVHISSPYGERIDDLQALGCQYHEIKVDRHGVNPIAEAKLIITYRKLIKAVKPDIVLGFTIKPNIYGAIAAAEKNIPFVANITGLGTAVENEGIKQKVLVNLYKIAFKKVQRVFFQNTENQQFFVDHGIAVDKHKLLPGSGVNLERFPLREYPGDEVIRFAFISRIMKEKGIDQYLEAAKAIKGKHPNTEFHICGFCEAEYEGRLDEYVKNGTVIYHGMIRDVSDFLKDIHCVVHPTYYPEGLSNVLLEACASGKPIITTDRPGCREVVEDGNNGYMIPQKDVESLVKAIEKFVKLSNAERKAMGITARGKVEKEFNRQIVVEAYMKEIY